MCFGNECFAYAANRVAYWLSVSPETSGWTWVGIPEQVFSWLIIVIGAVNIICLISDQVPIWTVVPHWLLAIDRDHIIVGLLSRLHPCMNIIVIFLEIHLMFKVYLQAYLLPQPSLSITTIRLID